MKKLILAAVMAASFSMHAYDNDRFNFSTLGESAIVFVGEVGRETATAMARISHGFNGRQGVYLEWHNTSGNACVMDNYDDYVTEGARAKRSMYNIGGQNVQMREYCRVRENSNENYIHAVAITDKGKKFIREIFAKLDEVQVTYSRGHKVTFDTRGFSIAWKNAGGDAL